MQAIEINGKTYKTIGETTTRHYSYLQDSLSKSPMPALIVKRGAFYYVAAQPFGTDEWDIAYRCPPPGAEA